MMAVPSSTKPPTPEGSAPNAFGQATAAAAHARNAARKAARSHEPMNGLQDTPGRTSTVHSSGTPDPYMNPED